MTEDNESGTTGGQVAPALPAEAGSTQGDRWVYPVPEHTQVRLTETIQEPAPVTEQQSTPVTVPTPVNPLENETMIREWMARIADTLVNATQLAGRVASLETRLADVQSDYDRVYSELRSEIRAHDETKAKALTEYEALKGEYHQHKQSAEVEIEYQRSKVSRAEDEALAQMQEVDRLKDELRRASEQINGLETTCRLAEGDAEHTRSQLNEATARHNIEAGNLNDQINRLTSENDRLKDKFRQTVAVWSA